jgi:SAM-dependent methyltransferase
VSFSEDWLALREPVDHRSRDPGLLDELSRHLAQRRAVTVVDLGCGAGSNLRALAPRLPDRQAWRLVDHDPALLAAARERLSAWAEAAEMDGSTLILRRESKHLAVTFQRSDLASDPDAALGEAPDLVTAAALFDLASPDWIGRLAAAAAARGASFYTALTYDGTECWEPPHPADGAMLDAFHAHQRRDKGFGPAAGPAATGVLSSRFADLGYRVRIAASPWRLGAADAGLIRELALGAAQAVRETGLVPEAEVSGWLSSRRQATACAIGHQDCLALPAERVRDLRSAAATS